MDDLNKKNYDPESEDEVLSEETERNELDKLVEEARAKTQEDVFKKNVQDWDGLVDEAQQEAEEFVYETSENISEEKIEGIEAPEYNEDDENLCCICHRRVKLEEDGEQYEYCKRCRDKFLSTKYNWKGVVTFLVTCVLSVFAVSMTVIALVFASYALKGDNYMEEGKYISAYNSYRQGLDMATTINDSAMTPDLFDCGIKTVRKMIKQNYEGGYIQTIGTVVEQYFSKEDLEKEENAEIKAIYEDYQKIVGTIGATSTYVEEFVYAEKFTKEELDKVIKTLEAFKSDEKYEKAFISYYQYYACTQVPDCEDLSLKYLEEIKKARPDFTWLYELGFANTYMSKGDFESAKKSCDTMIDRDFESMDAYSYKAKAERMQKNYDEALKICDEAIKIEKEICPYEDSYGNKSSGATVYGVYFERAVIYAIYGNLEKAQVEIEQAYNMMQTFDTVYLYAVLSKLNGYNELYDEAASLVQNEFPDNVQKLMDKKVTFEEVFTGGKVDWY